ncbi:unnamed protein product [Protopolystoma xenopodis]|uniref:Uncharacterized protein n=1 Tax=Protopolystoma xenopodis TaxID=117903 RepID=A0A3S5FEN1_9PLAT|nr:unnamed protein product [Protopolystoma xenopodis]
MCTSASTPNSSARDPVESNERTNPYASLLRPTHQHSYSHRNQSLSHQPHNVSRRSRHRQRRVAPDSDRRLAGLSTEPLAAFDELVDDEFKSAPPHSGLHSTYSVESATNNDRDLSLNHSGSKVNAYFGSGSLLFKRSTENLSIGHSLARSTWSVRQSSPVLSSTSCSLPAPVGRGSNRRVPRNLANQHRRRPFGLISASDRRIRGLINGRGHRSEKSLHPLEFASQGSLQPLNAQDLKQQTSDLLEMVI